MRVIAMTSLCALAACGGGGGGSDAAPEGLSERAQALAFGAQAGEAAANGLPFATDTSTLEDIAGAGPAKVKLVGAFTDHESGETQLIILDETATVTTDEDEIKLVTFNGQTLEFDEGSGPASVEGGTEWSLDTAFTSGDLSSTNSIYVYEGEENTELTGEFDAELFFVVGFETDPSEIEAINGSVTYFGELSGFGQLLDLDGNLVANEVSVSGDIEIVASFDDPNAVNGTLNASLDTVSFVDAVEMDFSAGINGNGYAADLNCTSGCSDQSSILAGAFYGQDALETSGLIGFDITSTVESPDDPNGPFDAQFVGGAGFTATQDGELGGDE